MASKHKAKEVQARSVTFLLPYVLYIIFFSAGYYFNQITDASSPSVTTKLADLPIEKASTAQGESLPGELSLISDPPKAENIISTDVDNSYERIMTAYENILRSCLGDYCFNARPEKSSRERIGVLGPPGTAADIISDILVKLALVEHPKVNSVEIVHSTNVPPYGYGKNHGWSRMIRVSRRVLPHAYSVLLAAEGHDGGSVSANNFDKQVRQLVRWQCRLSHVAAHTRMLTVFAEDILARPSIEFEKMMSFVGLRVSQKVLESVLSEFLVSLGSASSPSSDLSPATLSFVSARH